jgi:hypothetical protein
MTNIQGSSAPQDELETRTFSDSYRQVAEWLRCKVLDEQDVDSMLTIAELYGRMRWFNPDGVYHDDVVEDGVESKLLQSKALHLPIFLSGTATVLIASSLFDYGGHSRVVLNWMRAFREQGDHKLLVTRSIASKFKNTLESEGLPFHVCRSHATSLVNEILLYCANAERIVLHIHPDDIVAAIASKLIAKSGKPVFFYNHADHAFSFGVSSASLVCEISTYGIELNRRTGRVQKSCYLGIPISSQPPEGLLASATEAKTTRTVLTCGLPYKYAPGDAFFGDFIDNLLEKRNDVVIGLVGSTGNEPWWSQVRERWGTRLCFFGEIPYSEYVGIMKQADVYVDSFPITGGTAFPEALLSGRLVAGLNNPVQGYSPVDELRVDNIASLADEVINLLDNAPKTIQRVQQVRESTKAVHLVHNFRERVKSLYAGRLDENVAGNVPVDTFWLERRWANVSQISIPDTGIWFNLPLPFCIAFLLALDRLPSGSKEQHKRYLLTRIALKLLPAKLRAKAVAARELYLKIAAQRRNKPVVERDR